MESETGCSKELAMKKILRFNGKRADDDMRVYIGHSAMRRSQKWPVPNNALERLPCGDAVMGATVHHSDRFQRGSGELTPRFLRKQYSEVMSSPSCRQILYQSPIIQLLRRKHESNS